MTMQPLNTPHITFNPATGALDITVLGQVLNAKLSPVDLHSNRWLLPFVTSKLIEPVLLTVRASWDFIDTTDEIITLTRQEAALQEVMSYAFWWTTQHINSLDNVRRVHIQDLRRITNQCYALELSKQIKVAA